MPLSGKIAHRRHGRLAAGLILMTSLALGTSLAASSVTLATVIAAPASNCHLNSPTGAVQHVIYIQFDNVHFSRDNPNVPSDLEQMPNLLNFIKGNGTLFSNVHTGLIAHTADDILTSLTGNFPDKVGQPVANSFRYFNPNGTSSSASSFQYWTDPVSTTGTDQTYNLIDAAGKNTPAPWVPFTRAGCDVGAFSTADIELENTTSDIDTVYGVGSPQDQEADSSNAATRTKAVADFEGVSVHCAAASTLCSSANGGVPDNLPQEPGGYTGFNGLFGAKYVNPAITGGNPVVNDLDGNPIADSSGNPGFPGFNPTASQSLGYIAAMQEAGVPVTYVYISDAHDNHSAGGTYGPGEAGYVSQLQSYNAAFGKFFANLNAHGINASNTLFMFSADENDHFVGGSPSPANCDGVTVPCTYSLIGEVDGNLTGLLNAEDSGIASAHPFSVHADSAPTYYITGDPAQNDQTVTRPLERAVGSMTAFDPVVGGTNNVTNFLADQKEQKLLHMVTSDPARTPNFIQFANPDYFLFTDGASCDPTDAGANPCTVPEGHGGFAWNHGDVNPDINTTWMGMVGPGIDNLGVDGNTWVNQTDFRPTLMELAGLNDDYTHDGRVIWQAIATNDLPVALRGHTETMSRLADAYAQIESPVGRLGLDSLVASTRAAESGSNSDDSQYTNIDAQLSNLTASRDALAQNIQALFEGAEFGGHKVDEDTAKAYISQANALLAQADGLTS